jgi:hypothetical protein
LFYDKARGEGEEDNGEDPRPAYGVLKLVVSATNGKPGVQVLFRPADADGQEVRELPDEKGSEE